MLKIVRRASESTSVMLYRALKGNQLSLRRFISHGEQKLSAVDLAYSSYGESHHKKLVIMHGLLGSRSNWNSIAKAIVNSTKRHQVLTVDARNHGQSAHTDVMSYSHMAADLAHFIQEKGGSCILLGHSMGGRAAMFLALTKPEFVEKLIVVDISPVRSSPNLAVMGTYFQALRGIAIPEGTPLSEARKIADSQLQVYIKDAPIRQFLLMNLDLSKPGTLWRANIGCLEENFTNSIAAFPKLPAGTAFCNPTLFIAGKNSDYILPNDEDEISAMFPSAKFRYVEGADHWVHASKPTQFINIVVDFLRDS